MDKKRLYIIIGVCAAFVITILAIAIVAATQQPQNQQPAQQLQDYTGNLDCLPHKNVQPGQPQTLECAIGLKTTDGTYYGLKDIPSEYQYIEFSTKITVTGELKDAPADDKYDTAGTITVKTIQTLPSSD